MARKKTQVIKPVKPATKLGQQTTLPSKVTFEEWADEEFGMRSRREFKAMTDNDLRQIAWNGKAAQDELDRREAYDDRRAAALKAWSVTPRRKV